MTDATAAMAVVQIRVLGGAVADIGNDATAYGHRDRTMMVNIAAGYAAPTEADQHLDWVSRGAKRLFGDDAVYVNFLADADPERVRAAYPGGTWERLRALKRRYDPANRLRSNHNIPPADADPAATSPRP